MTSKTRLPLNIVVGLELDNDQYHGNEIQPETLPFVQIKNIDGNPHHEYWAVNSTGHYNTDLGLGRLYAHELMQYVYANPNTRKHVLHNTLDKAFAVDCFEKGPGAIALGFQEEICKLLISGLEAMAEVSFRKRLQMKSEELELLSA